MARAQGARSVLAFGVEGSYGVPPSAGNYLRAPFASTTLGTDQPLLADELLGYGRDPLPPELDASTTNGDVIVPIDTVMFGNWLKMTFGAASTADNGDGTFTHTWKTGVWDIPSFAVEKQMPEVPFFQMVKGCKVNSLEWTNERSGNLQATLGLLAQGENAPAGTSSAGTLTDLTFRRFRNAQGSIKRNGSLLANVVSSSFRYSNNLDAIETIRNDGLIDGLDPSRAELTGSVVTRFADRVLFDQAVAGTSCAIELAFTGASASLVVTIHEVYLPRPRVEIPGPAGIQATFDWQAAFNSAEDCMATVELTNEEASY